MYDEYEDPEEETYKGYDSVMYGGMLALVGFVLLIFFFLIYGLLVAIFP